MKKYSPLGPQKAVIDIGILYSDISVQLNCFSLLAGQEASCLCLEGDDDDGQFDVSLLLQLGQNPRPEEHLTLTNTIQVGIQIQVLYLEKTSVLQLCFHNTIL